MAPKPPLPEIGLRDPLHGRLACPELNPFHQGVYQISPREVLFKYRPHLKQGQMCAITIPPPIVERLNIDNEADGATGCFCTSVAPRPSVLASPSKRSGRDLKATMSQSGKARDRRGCEFRKESANDVSY